MTKWILIIGAIILAGVLFLIGRGGTKSSYINGLPGYNEMPNQEYIFQRAGYIFKDDNRSSAYPYVGTHGEVPGLPEVVAADQVGTAINGLRILDTVRVGDRFRIISVRRDERPDDVTVTYEILFSDELERSYPRLDAYYLLDHSRDADGVPPPLQTRLAVPRIKS